MLPEVMLRRLKREETRDVLPLEMRLVIRNLDGGASKGSKRGRCSSPSASATDGDALAVRYFQVDVTDYWGFSYAVKDK